MDLQQKLTILADAAKYDASCASSGTTIRNSKTSGGIGSTTGSGICHSYTPDGRCVSLLKILLTNYCVYDCLYCVNRVSSSVPRARFAVDEVVKLTLDFYRRNYIEGLFLSSGIIRNADYTMEQVVSVARKLREEHGFKGYIHLKTIPEASQLLINEAGRWADRISINIELPTAVDLAQLAPEKNLARIEGAIARARPPPGTRIVTAAVYQPGGMSAGLSTVTNELMEIAGLHNVAVDHGIEDYRPLSLEQLISSPPQILLVGETTRGAPTHAERVVHHRALRALQSRMLRESFPARLIYCSGPTMIDALDALVAAREHSR
jgi:hypothetical protein